MVKEYRKSDGTYLEEVLRNVEYDVLPCSPSASDTTICSGSSVQLNASVGVSYSWSPPAGLSNPNISNPVATPVTPTTYTVTVTKASGCTVTSIVNISISSPPTITINSSSNITPCSGQSVTLTAGGGAMYVWSPSSSLSSDTGSSVTATPTATTTYTVTDTDIYGCTNTNSLTITAGSLIAPTITVNNATICNGNPATLNAGGALTYAWSPSSGLSSSSGTTVTANPSSTTTYTVTDTSANGCTNTKT